MEIENAHVDNVVFDHRGVVVIVSGIARLFIPRVEGDPEPPRGGAKLIRLPIKKGEIRYIGGELYAVSPWKQKAYEARILSMKGTKQNFQLWGTSAVIEGGHVVRIITRIATHLIPEKSEARFAIGRLPELEERKNLGPTAPDEKNKQLR